MTKETLNNYPDDEELRNFFKELSDPKFIQSIEKEEERDYYKAKILEFKIKKWLDKRFIKITDNIKEFLNILDLEEQKIYKKKENLLTNPYQEKLNEIKIIRQHLDWFIRKYNLSLRFTIQEFLIFLKNLIEEKKRFLFKNPQSNK